MTGPLDKAIAHRLRSGWTTRKIAATYGIKEGDVKRVALSVPDASRGRKRRTKHV